MIKQHMEWQSPLRLPSINKGLDSNRRSQTIQRNYWNQCNIVIKEIISCSLGLGSVWIELILLKLKTENWKHCNKIIFKCVNSAVEPIFNEKVAEKWWETWTVGAKLTAEKSKHFARKKKKKRNKNPACKTQTWVQWIQTYT